MTPAIKTKRWDDPAEADDGARILITRYRPRALPKEDETWTEWIKELGPSAELHAAVYGKNGQPPISWSAYLSHYKREMLKHRPEISELARRVLAGESITLLCSSQCIHENRCHRTILRDLILAEIEKLKQSA